MGTGVCQEYIEQFGDAVIVPGECVFDIVGIESVAKFIKGIAERIEKS